VESPSRVTDLSPEGKRAVTESETEKRSRAIEIFGSIDVDAYKYYSAGEAGVFWSLLEAAAFKRLYDYLGVAIGEQGAGRDSWETTQGYITRWFSVIERYFREGAIDSEKLLSQRAKARDRTFKRITAYYTSKEGPTVRDNLPWSASPDLQKVAGSQKPVKKVDVFGAGEVLVGALESSNDGGESV
jgi:hypothetical protein